MRRIKKCHEAVTYIITSECKTSQKKNSSHKQNTNVSPGRTGSKVHGKRRCGNERSTRTTRHTAKALLDECRAKGWQVIFIGADFDNGNDYTLSNITAADLIGDGPLSGLLARSTRLPRRPRQRSAFPAA